MHDITYDRYFFSFKCRVFPDGKCIQQGLRGVFIDTVTCIDDGGRICLARKWGAPLALCLITTMSTFIERILLTVSSRDSPLETEEPEP